MSSSNPDHLPDDLAATIRDEDADDWLPPTGPMEWEDDVETKKATWWTGEEVEQGVAIMDAKDDAWLLSTVFCPNLERMV